MNSGSCKMERNGEIRAVHWDSAMRRIVLIIAGLLLLAGVASRAESLAWTRAHELYQRTDYAGSLDVLLAAGKTRMPRSCS